MKSINYFFKARPGLAIASLTFRIIFLLAIFSAEFVYGHSSVSDWFYIPGNTSAVNIHDEFDAADWQNSNWFTFGTTGHQEVTVYSHYVADMLYLAFIIRDDTLVATKDKVSICIDPTNSGTGSEDNPFIKIDLILTDPGYELRVSTCAKNCDHETNWIELTNPHDFADGDIYTDAKNNYWQALFKINCSAAALGQIDKESMGLYFKVLDHTTDIYFTTLQWPNTASINTADSHYLPPANEWANAHWIQASSETRPDVYFRPSDLRTANLPNNLEIKLGQQNKILTKIINKYFAPGSVWPPVDNEIKLTGDPDQGSVSQNRLVFKYANFGVDCFESLDSLENAVVLANDSLDTNIVWDPTDQIPEQQSMLVTLRTEFSSPQDAITSDNIIHRDMQYIVVPEGTTTEFPVVITNCDEQIPNVSSNDARGLPLMLAANGLLPAQLLGPDSMETVYLYLDRSGLYQKGTLEGYWKIDLIPAEADTINPIIGVKDRFYIKFAPGEKKKFNLRITTPKIGPFAHPNSGCCLWNPFGLFGSGNKRLESPESVSSAEPISAKSVMKKSPEIQRPNGHPSSFFYRVYKPVQSYVTKDTLYYRMRTMGYFGANLLVIPKKPDQFWQIFKYIFGTLVLSGGVYYWLTSRK